MSALTWFEIPVQDFDRAVNFYEQLLQISLRRELFAGTMPNAIFPYEATGVGGAVAQVPYAKAGNDGPIVYLKVQSMAVFDQALQDAERLGGKVLMPKMDIGPAGSIALVQDPEGNRVGLNLPLSQ